MIANTCVKCIRTSQNTEQHKENTNEIGQNLRYKKENTKQEEQNLILASQLKTVECISKENELEIAILNCGDFSMYCFNTQCSEVKFCLINPNQGHENKSTTSNTNQRLLCSTYVRKILDHIKK